jgi:hypothetical protein
MGWIISVGKAGAKGRLANTQPVSLRVDVQGLATQVRVFPDSGTSPAWQAQRVLQTVLSTLVGN